MAQYLSVIRGQLFHHNKKAAFKVPRGSTYICMYVCMYVYIYILQFRIVL